MVNKVATASGTTAVQVIHKQRGTIKRIEHIGSAHSNMDRDQLKLELFPEEPLLAFTERAYSKLLRDCLSGQCDALGFTTLGDDVFHRLVLARIIESTSKTDTIRYQHEWKAQRVPAKSR